MAFKSEELFGNEQMIEKLTRFKKKSCSKDIGKNKGFY